MRHVVQNKFETFSEVGETHVKVFTMEKPKLPVWNGAALKALREQKNWKPEDLALAVGVRRTDIYRWENSDHDPGIDKIAAFAILFGVSPMAFVTGVDDYQAFAVQFNPRWKEEERARRERREAKPETPIEFVDIGKVNALPPGQAPSRKPPKATGEPRQSKPKHAPKSPKPTDK